MIKQGKLIALCKFQIYLMILVPKGERRRKLIKKNKNGACCDIQKKITISKDKIYLALHLSEPVEQLVDVGQHLGGPLLAQRDPLAPPLDLLADGVEPPVVPGDQVLHRAGAVAGGHLAQLRAGDVDAVQQGPVVLHVLLQPLDLHLLVLQVVGVEGLDMIREDTLALMSNFKYVFNYLVKEY